MSLHSRVIFITIIATGIVGASTMFLIRESCSEWNTASFFEDATPVMVRLCVGTGSDSNVQDSNGLTPLHWGVWTRNEKIIEALLHGRSNPNYQNNDGDTPLHWAVRAGEEEILQTLLDGDANPNIRNGEGLTPLYLARHKIGITLTLLKANADPNLTPEDNVSLVHWAVRESQGGDLITLLVRGGGADPNTVDEVYGATPLHWAVARGEPDQIDALISSGAHVNGKDVHGATPLHWAARQMHREMRLNAGNSTKYWNVKSASEAIVVMMLAAKADPNSKDEDGNTPLHWAVREGHLDARQVFVASRPIAEQRSERARAVRNLDIRKMERLMEAGAQLDLRNKKGETALHLALKVGATAKARLLLEGGADPKMSDRDEITALLCLSAPGAWPSNVRGVNLDLVRLLLEVGADPNARCEGEATLLHLAAYRMNSTSGESVVPISEFVQLLLGRRCKP